MAGDLDRLVRADVEGWQPSLVICPKAMLYTWGGWFATMRPEERVIVIDPRTKATRKAFEDALKGRTHDVYIIHYEGLKLLLPLMHPIDWLHIIADEAHRIANRKSATSKAVRTLKAKWRTALTGTPADRAPDQLWAVLNFLDKKTWSSYWAFRQRYVAEDIDPIRGYRTVTGANREMLPELHARLRPIMVRRRKEDVLKELPPKQYENVWVDLSAKQRKVYAEMRDNMLSWVGEQGDEPLQASVVIAQLIRLQQIALATPTFVQVTRRVRQYWTDAEGEYLRDKQGARIHAGLPLVDREDIDLILEDPSSKLDAAMEIINELVAVGEKVVIFSQFTKIIDLLCDRLGDAGIYTGKYTGQTRHNTRTRIEQEFTDGDLMVFAAQIQAGGVGLNLQAASTIIFLDRAWKPGDNLQAEDRIHRMGQLAEHVTIIDIMARGTIDRGRHQHIRLNWREVQKMLGDTHFDWTHSIDDPDEELEEPAF